MSFTFGPVRDLESCTRCHVDYPSELLSPFHTYNREAQRVCGICALELTNAVHGTATAKFHGEQVEWLRIEALNWRERHRVKA
jgi:hypothetical protein